jgi:hypothetical protein
MTKSLFAILLTANALAGCAQLPGVPAPEQVVETKVYRAPHAKVLPAKLEAEKPGQDPNYVSHDVTNWTTPSVPTPAPKAAAGKTPAYLEVAEVPTRAFRAYPVFDFKDQVVDARFSPANADPTWELSAVGDAIVSKVKVELVDDGGTHKDAFEVSADELALPAKLEATQVIKLPLGNPGFISFLGQCPDTKKVQLTATLEGPDGKPLANRDGKPVSLVLPIDVM